MSSLKVLLVENDELFRKVFKECLARQGLEVDEAPDGRVAREILKVSAYDMVISDIEMPHFTGIELFEWCQENRPTPFILMTGFTHILNAQEAAELGVSGYLEKPFDEKVLWKELEKASQWKLKETRRPLATKKNVEYCKILIDDFIAGSKIPFSIYIRVSDSKYIKIAHSGEDISITQIKSYKSKNVNYLYVTKNDYHKLVGFNLKLTKAVVNRDYNHDLKLRFLKYTGELIAQNVFVSDMDSDLLASSKEFVQLSLNVVGDDLECLQLLNALNSHSDYIYAHSLGVSVYAVMISRALGWESPQTAFKVSLAGLFHDIGKKEIAREIIEKQRALQNQEERKLYETHPVRGKEILESLKSISSDVIEAAHQHHESCLGRGYPRGLSRERIHPIAKLIAVANVFCNLAIKSPHSDGMSAREAVAEMQSRYCDELDPECLSALKKVVR